MKTKKALLKELILNDMLLTLEIDKQYGDMCLMDEHIDALIIMLLQYKSLQQQKESNIEYWKSKVKDLYE